MNISNNTHDRECPNCGVNRGLIIKVDDGEKTPTFSGSSESRNPFDIRVWACQNDGVTYFHREIVELEE